MQTYLKFRVMRRETWVLLVAIGTLLLTVASCSKASDAGGGGASGGGSAGGTVSGGASQSGSGGQVSVTVSIPANAKTLGAAAYGTNPLVITAGATVTWVNNDSVPHTATSDTGAWDSGTIAAGGSFSVTFNSVGTFPYHCTIDGSAAMSGVIQVDAAATTTTTTTTTPGPSLPPWERGTDQ